MCIIWILLKLRRGLHTLRHFVFNIGRREIEQDKEGTHIYKTCSRHPILKIMNQLAEQRILLSDILFEGMLMWKAQSFRVVNCRVKISLSVISWLWADFYKRMVEVFFLNFLWKLSAGMSAGVAFLKLRNGNFSVAGKILFRISWSLCHLPWQIAVGKMPPRRNNSVHSAGSNKQALFSTNGWFDWGAFNVTFAA